MADDFLRLVSQANPAAARQYQQPSNYDPFSSNAPHASGSHAPAQQLDPFFDDDDVDAPDSAFAGVPGAMRSTESGIPLRQAAAAPAGTTLNDDDAKAKTWTFDDDEPASLPYQGSAAFPGAPTPTEGAQGKVKRRGKRWRWPWEKEEEKQGERVIALNNTIANTEFVSNYVSTSKYNMVTFTPKFFFGA
jgi:phospholipid-transporting ATPase